MNNFIFLYFPCPVFCGMKNAILQQKSELEGRKSTVSDIPLARKSYRLVTLNSSQRLKFCITFLFHFALRMAASMSPLATLTVIFSYSTKSLLESCLREDKTLFDLPKWIFFCLKNEFVNYHKFPLH